MHSYNVVAHEAAIVVELFFVMSSMALSGWQGGVFGRSVRGGSSCVRGRHANLTMPHTQLVSGDVVEVSELGVDDGKSAGAKCVGGTAGLIMSQVNAVLTDRHGDVGIEVVRLHREQLLASHSTEIN
jgi:hypothetical protein